MVSLPVISVAAFLFFPLDGQREREREKHRCLSLRDKKAACHSTRVGSAIATHCPKGNLRDHYLYHTLGQMQMQNIFLSGLRVTMMQYNNIPHSFSLRRPPLLGGLCHRPLRLN